MNSHGYQQISRVVAVAAMALLASAGGVLAKPLRTTLNATAAVPGARGKAKLDVKGTRGAFEIVGQKLERNTAYDVIVDGVKVATLQTTGGGSGKVKFKTQPKGHDVFLGFDPRGKSVMVRSATGDDVLEVEFPNEAPEDAAKVACCIPDDSGSECEDRTETDCAAQGGVLAGVDSCMPDPCAGVTPPGGEDQILCCLPDNGADDTAEAECEDVTSAACAAAGGTALQATSCDPNPCAPVPPANTVVCCVPDDAGAECEVRTPDHCTALGGTAVDATSCDPNPCGTTTGGGGGGGGGGGADDPSGHQ